MKSERISPFWVNGYQPFSAAQHCMIDTIVLNYLGLEKEETYIKNMLQNMIDRRMKKSKTK